MEHGQKQAHPTMGRPRGLPVIGLTSSRANATVAGSYTTALRAIQAWRDGSSPPVVADYPGAKFDAEILDTRRRPPSVPGVVPLQCGDHWLVLLRDIEPETLGAVRTYMASVSGCFDVVVSDPYLHNLLSRNHATTPDLGQLARIRADTRVEDLSPIARTCGLTFDAGQLKPFVATTAPAARAITMWAPGGSRILIAPTAVSHRARHSLFTVPGRRDLVRALPPSTGLAEIDFALAERRRRLLLPPESHVPYPDQPVEIAIL